MKRVLAWSFEYADVLVTLILAIVISALDVSGVASTGQVANATVVTLAAVAFVLLRDRARSDGRGTAILESTADTNARLDDLSARLERRSALRIVSGSECNRVLAEARKNTARWVFKGSTGAYVRAVTLPECVSNARPFRRELTFRLEILDPADTELCARFVGLHQRLATSVDSPERSWTMDGTRRELYATILAACWYLQRYEFLNIDLRLSSTVSLLRYEMSTTCMIITQRGPEFPATIVESGSPVYESWDSELKVSLQEARRVPMDAARSLPLSEEPTPGEIQALFQRLGMALPAEYDDDDLVELRTMALHAADPYDKAARWG